MRRRLRSHPWLAVAGALAIAGCGGGGSGGTPAPTPTPAPSPTPTPTPANQAPVFTSAASASVPENSSGTIYTATASDADGNALTFSLAGGADQALLRITASGALSFATPPDFEAPADADGNNVYLVRIGVSDGMTSATLDLSVTVTNSGTDAFRVTRVGTGFAQPLFVAPLPDGSGRVFVVEKGGRIRILTPGGASVLFLDLSALVSTNGERGLLGLATAPDFQATGNFYVYLTNPQGNIELRRYRTTAARDIAEPTSGDVLLVIPHSGANNHNGGWIGFGPDNLLYLGVGDGGGSGDPSNNAQNTNLLLGKMLRIDVSRDDFPADANRDYGIPASNPFATGGGAGEIWAVGLRNPFRASFDPVTGNLFIGDVGEGAIEEIDLMRPSDGGANFGWSVLEGTRQFKGPGQPSFMPPVAEYPHGTGPLEGRTVTGGYVYRGPVESLQGLYFFADFISSNIWSLPLSELVPGSTAPNSRFTNRRADFTPNAGAIGSITSFGVDQAGNLYIVDFDGEIFRVERAQP